MLVQQGQGRRGLAHADELLGALQDIFGFLVRWRRLRRGSVYAGPRPRDVQVEGVDGEKLPEAHARGQLTMMGGLFWNPEKTVR